MVEEEQSSRDTPSVRCMHGGMAVVSEKKKAEVLVSRKHDAQGRTRSRRLSPVYHIDDAAGQKKNSMSNKINKQRTVSGSFTTWLWVVYVVPFDEGGGLSRYAVDRLIN